MSDKVELNKLNEFELLDKLSSMLGIATKESKEESWNDVITHRKTLRRAIIELDKAWI